MGRWLPDAPKAAIGIGEGSGEAARAALVEQHVAAVHVQACPRAEGPQHEERAAAEAAAKEAAKAWREANVEDRSHITSALSLLEDSIKTLDRPAQKAKLRISTESVAEELFDDASHATTHTYLPDGLPVAV